MKKSQIRTGRTGFLSINMQKDQKGTNLRSSYIINHILQNHQALRDWTTVHPPSAAQHCSHSHSPTRTPSTLPSSYLAKIITACTLINLYPSLSVSKGILGGEVTHLLSTSLIHALEVMLLKITMLAVLAVEPPPQEE